MIQLDGGYILWEDGDAWWITAFGEHVLSRALKRELAKAVANEA